jgi:DNA-binding MarR family transcriptional regulator
MMHMHHDSLRLDGPACACTALRKASRAATRLYDEVMAGTGMSIAQFAILRNIARNAPIPLSRLADLLVMDRTTLYRGLRPLERDGWVAIDAANSRVKTARLTDAGRKAMLDATDAWEDAQRRLLDRFSRPDWASVETSLAQLVTIASEERP